MPGEQRELIRLGWWGEKDRKEAPQFSHLFLFSLRLSSLFLLTGFVYVTRQFLSEALFFPLCPFSEEPVFCFPKYTLLLTLNRIVPFVRRDLRRVGIPPKYRPEFAGRNCFINSSVYQVVGRLGGPAFGVGRRNTLDVY